MKRNLLGTLGWILLMVAPASAQITVPFTFINGTAANADDVNTNFSTVASQALNRTGGTITGNITVDPGVTIDGIDISAYLGGTGTPTFASLTVSGALTAGTLSGNGASLTSLSATNIASGTLGTARGGTGADTSGAGRGSVLFATGTGLWSVLPASTFGHFLRTNGGALDPSWSNDGSVLVSLNASNLASGTINDGRLSANVPLINAGTNTFTGAMRFGTSQVFSWVGKSVNTVYQAASDGFVVVIVDPESTGGGSGLGEGLTDAANPPTTPRARSRYANGLISFMFPVRKNDFYKVVDTPTAGAAAYTVYWVPMGTAG